MMLCTVQYWAMQCEDERYGKCSIKRWRHKVWLQEEHNNEKITKILKEELKILINSSIICIEIPCKCRRTIFTAIQNSKTMNTKLYENADFLIFVSLAFLKSFASVKLAPHFRKVRNYILILSCNSDFCVHHGLYNTI